MASRQDELIGVTINNFTILEKLGEGGMGIVYRARHPDLGLEVAIKVMRPDLANREGFYASFKREAQTVARLEHRNIVRVRNFGKHPETNTTYLEMELVGGPSLRVLLRDSPFGLPTNSAVEIIEQVARALDYAHSQGVLHLDLKPDNILLDPLPAYEKHGNDSLYRPVISDFGLARLRMAPGVSIHTTQRIGTPHYMSPEQCRGEGLNEKSDIYSLGVMLYEILTGQRPFPVSTLAHAVYYHGSQQPDPPSSHSPGLPAAIDEVVLAMLAKDLLQRPASSREVADRLADLLPSLTPAVVESAPITQGAVVTPAEVEAWSPTSGQVAIRVLYQGKQVDRHVMQAESIVAGRVAPCDLLLDSEDRMISKRHCEITFDGDVMKVRDLRSTNKTFLNEQALEPSREVTWPSGTPLRMGLFTLYWEKLAPQEAPPEPLPLPEPVPAPEPALVAEAPSYPELLPEAAAPPPAEPPLLMCNDSTPKTIQLGHKPAYIGRLPGCELVIADSRVSKRHCAVYWDGSAVHVKDLGSTNGTILGEKQLAPQELTPWQPHEELKIGPYEICLTADEATRMQVR